MFIEFVNENLWLFVALAIVFNLLLLSVLQGSVRGANRVSALEMPALQRKGKSVIIDVNKVEHYATSHIPKSANFPLEELNAENKNLLKHKDSTVIVTCQTGSRSTKAAKQLLTLGFTNVNILNGGLVGWSKENLPLTKVKA
ncbi:MAG: rhodanese-related sulfurtransferase [Arenicella sp.]|jgi:rhodanese-related sulfurtransferase